MNNNTTNYNTWQEQNLKSAYDFSDVLICPRKSTINSRKDISLSRKFITPVSKQTISCIPIVASNMDTVGTMSMAKEFDLATTSMQNLEAPLMVALHKHYSEKEYFDYFKYVINYNAWKNNIFYTVGVDDTEFVKLKNLRKSLEHHSLATGNSIYGTLNYDDVFLLNIDIANGYIPKMLDTIEKYRQEFPNAVICAGNIVTPERAVEFYRAGADIAKIGIGSGSCCLTRAKSGVGYPQLSAILECQMAAEDTGILLMSDGGCTVPGDICKAFVAGSDFVMIGGMLAGHDECELDIEIDEHGRKIMPVYGMSSGHAMKKRYGRIETHRTSEGRYAHAEYKGPVKNTVNDILGGLRSCGTYINASEIEQFSNAGFVKVNKQLNNIFGE